MDYIQFTIITVMIFIIADTSAQEIEKTPCQKERIGALRSKSPYVPRCTRDGEFERLQCQCVENKAANIKACRTRGHGCWCADLQGNKIPGTVKADAQYTDCVTGKYFKPCIVKLMKFTYRHANNTVKPKCTSDGEYMTVQCNERSCYCVDTIGNIVQGTTMTGSVKPSCTEYSLTKCQKKRADAIRLHEAHVPQCTETGEYDKLQCDQLGFVKRCWCADKSGMKIPGTLKPKLTQTNCETGKIFKPCVAALIMFYYHDMFGTFRPQCHPDGEYDRLQCYNSLCYCVDEHGKKIKGTETEAGGVPPCGALSRNAQAMRNGADSNLQTTSSLTISIGFLVTLITAILC